MFAANPSWTAEIEAFLGQQHPLVEQLESADGLSDMQALAAELTSMSAATRGALRRFLAHYRDEVLFPVELAAIQRAHDHAIRHETRELIAFDASLSDSEGPAAFASASRRIGRHQLACLRPLRDQRLVQRYLAAVEEGDAHGWHTLVYGVTLAVYSLPIRQGLHAYASRTLEGFIKSPSSPLRQDEAAANELLEALLVNAQETIEALLEDESRESAFARSAQTSV